jgi:protein-tyrosine phosphatase
VSDSESTIAQGLVNLRDLGGLPLLDGGVTRAGVLFRSESLQEATEDDRGILLDQHRITSVVDLRSARETITEGRGPFGTASVTYVNVPLNPAPVDLSLAEGLPPGALTAQVYRAFADDLSGGLPRVFRLLPTLLEDATLVHCAAGKDRTGLVIAMTLEIAGVRREAVIDDYLESAENNHRVNEMLSRSPRYQAHMDKVHPEFYEVHELAITRYLESLDRDYGGVRGWAAARGITDDQLDRISRAMRGQEWMRERHQP